MKVVIPDNLKGSELFKFLKENKSALIAQKKAIGKHCDAISFTPEYYQLKDKAAIKTVVNEIPSDATTFKVKVVANAALWMDSQRDVLLPDCWQKSISEGKGRLHLKDHAYKIDAEVGDVTNVYSQNISLSDLGINKPGLTQCLIYESNVNKLYDEKTFAKYKAGKINQHSIGLNYVVIELSVNDNSEYYKEEYANWIKYVDQIINKEEAEKVGYFWVVKEIKLIEVSAVLLGSNELTPTLEVGGKSTDVEPPISTQQQPPIQPFNVSEAIKTTTFF